MQLRYPISNKTAIYGRMQKALPRTNRPHSRPGIHHGPCCLILYSHTIQSIISLAEVFTNQAVLQELKQL